MITFDCWTIAYVLAKQYKLGSLHDHLGNMNDRLDNMNVDVISSIIYVYILLMFYFFTFQDQS